MATFIKKIFTGSKDGQPKINQKAVAPLITPRRKKGERIVKSDSPAKKIVSYIDKKYIKYTVSNDFKNPVYDEIYEKSIANKEKFWQEQA